MKQARCWLVSNRIMPAECGGGGGGDDSWEERAFAEDTSGVLGGCVWPPRSYSCNFCRREFRSAQALGGHMNVHRRDRARLKLMSSSAKSHHLGDQKSYGGHLHHLHNNHHNSNQDVAIIDENPSLFASSNNNIPKSQFIPSFVVSNNHHEKTLSFFCLNSNNDDEKDKDLVVPFKITKNHEIKDTYSPFIGLSTSLTLVADDDEDDDVPNNRNKRRKVDSSSSSPIVMITNKVEDETTKVDDDDGHGIEELDLELRLGDRPKVQ